MTDASLAYARSIRRFAEASAKVGAPVVLTIDPPSAIYLSHLIERGCQRSQYVRAVQAEAERLRDAAEETMLVAQDVNAAADRALDRCKERQRTAWWLMAAAAGFLCFTVLVCLFLPRVLL
jgi:hypothetical protein